MKRFLALLGLALFACAPAVKLKQLYNGPRRPPSEVVLLERIARVADGSEVYLTSAGITCENEIFQIGWLSTWEIEVYEVLPGSHSCKASCGSFEKSADYDITFEVIAGHRYRPVAHTTRDNWNREFCDVEMEDLGPIGGAG